MLTAQDVLAKDVLDCGNAYCPRRFSRKNQMNDIPSKTATPAPEPALEAVPKEVPKKVLSPAAQRALAEAEARRAAAAAEAKTVAHAKEFQGPDGPEPTRFGDWERKGIASDF
jgi:hypothetical protein